MAQAVSDQADHEVDETWKVLEFGLGSDTYCLRIDTIDEIVDATELTPIPNAPPHVEGVMDLRGRTTTIVDPAVLFGIDTAGDRDRILVLEQAVVDGDGTVGWMVDDVYRVRDVSATEVDKTTISDQGGIRGIIRSGEEDLVVWLEPRTDEPAPDVA